MFVHRRPLAHQMPAFPDPVPRSVVLAGARKPCAEVILNARVARRFPKAQEPARPPRPAGLRACLPFFSATSRDPRP